MRVLWLGCLCLAWLVPGFVRAEACKAGQNGVDVRVEVTPVDDALRAAILEHLGAALESRGMAPCELLDETAKGVARVFVLLDTGFARAEVRIGDAVTDKRVERTLALGRLPKDGYALAVAASADELLRASWAELLLEDAPPPPAPVPAAVTETLEASVKPRKVRRRTELFAELSGNRARRRAALGPRLFGAFYATNELAVIAGLSLEFARARQSEHGTVAADAQSFELGLSYAPLGARRPYGFALDAAGSVARLTFSADADPDAEARSFAAISYLAHARVRAFLGQGPLRGQVSVGGRYALRPARAHDEGRTVTSNQGLGLEVSLGVGAFF